MSFFALYIDASAIHMPLYEDSQVRNTHLLHSTLMIDECLSLVL